MKRARAPTMAPTTANRMLCMVAPIERLLLRVYSDESKRCAAVGHSRQSRSFGRLVPSTSRSRDLLERARGPWRATIVGHVREVGIGTS
jgi:hypothetical protein